VIPSSNREPGLTLLVKSVPNKKRISCSVGSAQPPFFIGRLTSGIRKLSPAATAPRTCRHMAARRHPGEVVARRRSPITRTRKMVRPPSADAAQIMDAGAFRAARIPQAGGRGDGPRAAGAGRAAGIRLREAPAMLLGCGRRRSTARRSRWAASSDKAGQWLHGPET
jgi:hypothetical protein